MEDFERGFQAGIERSIHVAKNLEDRWRQTVDYLKSQPGVPESHIALIENAVNGVQAIRNVLAVQKHSELTITTN